jgi:Ca2+-binding RTX toxin-like protein
MPIQTTDIHKTLAGEIGIDYTAFATYWAIDRGVTVASDFGTGVESTHNSSTLFNHGVVMSGQHLGTAIDFSGQNSLIYNAADGLINGTLKVQDNNIVTINYGSIESSMDGLDFTANSVDSRLLNFGEVHAFIGILDNSQKGSNAITNLGNIDSELGIGIVLATAPALVTQVINSGSISGGYAAIYGQIDGALDLHNSGTLTGDVLLTALRNDTVINTGHIAGDVYLGGDDVFAGSGGNSGTVFGELGNDKLTAGSSADTLLGGDGVDTIIGGAGADTLNGGNDVDTIDGGLGIDRLSGGAGNDKFVFDAVLGANNRDVVTDFVHGHDKLHLDNAVFKALGANGAFKSAYFWAGSHAHDANDHIIYNKATGALYYDDDGSGAHEQVLFAVLTNKPVNVNYHDFQVI